MNDTNQIDQIRDNPDEEWGGWFECDEGWRPLIAELHEKIKALAPGYTISQVKEKFGGLRYYASAGDIDDETSKKFYDLIHEAEAKSYGVCERCGQPGRLSKRGGWYKTLCSTCAGRLNFEPLRDSTDELD